MKKIFSSLVIGLCLFSQSLAAQVKASPEAEKFFTTAMAQINAKHVAWIKTTARTMNDKKMAETEAKSFATKYATANRIANTMDIEALTFFVLMQSAKEAEQDLRFTMAEMKSINEKKKALREAKEKLKQKNQAITRVQVDSFKLLLQNRPAIQKTNTTFVQPVKTPSRDTVKKLKNTITPKVSSLEIDDLVTKLQDSHDSMSEQSEQQQLRMQMIMDRMTKADSAASNAMKKFSEVAGSIISNLK